MHRNLSAKEAGFTIIELLIATVVFSVVLVVFLAAFVQVSRLFYKGVNMTNTQEDTRTITQDIEDDIRFAKGPPTGQLLPLDVNPASANKQGIFCIGLHRYSYNVGHQYSGVPPDYAFKRDTISASAGCTSSAPVDPGKGTEELLSNGMQLNHLYINCTVNAVCTVNVHVVFYGGTPDGLFASAASPSSSSPWLEPDAECTGAINSSQYCATADFSRSVLERI